MKDTEGVVLDPKRVLTPVARANWVYVLEPDTPKEADKKPQYRMEMIFPAGTDLSALQEVAVNAVKKRWNVKPEGLHNPFRNGNAKAKKLVDKGKDHDEEDVKVYTNSIYVNVKEFEKPRVGAKINGKFVDIDDPEIIYNGMKCRAVLAVSTYSNKGNEGVSFWLKTVVKTDDGEKLSQRNNPDADLGDIPDSNPNSIANMYSSSSSDLNSLANMYSSSTPSGATDSEYENEKYFKKDSGVPDFLKDDDREDGIPF